MPYVWTSPRTRFAIPSVGEPYAFAPPAWYARGLHAAIAPGFNPQYNLATQTPINPTATRQLVAVAPSYTATPAGLASATKFALTSTTSVPSAGSTVLTVAWFGGTPALFAFAAVSRSNHLVSSYGGGALYASITPSSGGGPTVSTGAVTVPGAVNVIASTVVSGGGVSVFHNGVNLGTSGATWNGTSSNNYDVYAQGEAASTSVALLSLFWFRKLSDAEVRDVSKDFRMFFRPLVRTLFSFPSAIVIPTLSSAGVVSVTSSSATPRVTLTF